jgi:hypothetical protein
LEKPDEVDEYFLGCDTAKYAPLLDESFSNQDGEYGFDIYHYPITENGKQCKPYVAQDKLTRSELRLDNFTRNGLGDEWYSEL